ncbi:DMT family transporter [Deefgea piscis]|uniref:DMT family transporter n=1 Tax=Deefgea piscis TaxID=2739061 RepID=UPI001C820E89|nr:DMT family transporter [Deefgea piscis]QZA80789.1 DMT family transporter [Deefgea piscis]
MNWFFPLVAVAIWAGNTVVSKAAAGVIDPAAISFYRWLIAGLILTPIMAPKLWRQRLAIGPYWPKFAVLALLGMVLYQCLAYFAAHSTTATNMGVICALIPLLGLLLNWAFFRFRPNGRAMIGVGFSLLGVLYLLGQGQPSRLLAGGINHGDGLMLIGALAYALYGILLKRWALPFSPWLNLYLQIGFGVLFLIPVALSAQSLAIAPAAISMVLFAGIASSIVAAYCWMQGIGRMGSEKTAIFMNLLPLLTALIAVLVLGETLHVYHYLGGGLILFGVFLVQFRQSCVES